MMNINSQHHNLLGNQISPKSEDFCIWWPFCTLVTMKTQICCICHGNKKGGIKKKMDSFHQTS
jgi:hypothetical protein